MDRTQHSTSPAAVARAAEGTDGRAALGAARSRRDFLRASGLGGAALLVTGALAACADGARAVAPTSGPAVVSGNDITLDFSSDVDVLNYAYALEQLEAAFYSQAVAAPGFASRFADNEQRVLVDIRDHEVVHREFFRTALGGNAIPALTPNFGAVDFADRGSVLQTARTFEDLGVSAFNGAAGFLRSPALLTLAGKIVSVEARHASAIRDLLAPRSGSFAPNSFDPATAPAEVLAAAGPFIAQHITVINA